MELQIDHYYFTCFQTFKVAFSSLTSFAWLWPVFRFWLWKSVWDSTQVKAGSLHGRSVLFFKVRVDKEYSLFSALYSKSKVRVQVETKPGYFSLAAEHNFKIYQQTIWLSISLFSELDVSMATMLLFLTRYWLRRCAGYAVYQYLLHRDSGLGPVLHVCVLPVKATLVTLWK